jgi:hypothetical protein
VHHECKSSNNENTHGSRDQATDHTCLLVVFNRVAVLDTNCAGVQGVCYFLPGFFFSFGQGVNVNSIFGDSICRKFFNDSILSNVFDDSILDNIFLVVIVFLVIVVVVCVATVAIALNKCMSKHNVVA